MTVITVLATLMTQADKLILSKLLSLEQFGHYTLTVTIATVITSLTVPLSNVALPVLNRLVSLQDSKGLAHQYHIFSQILTIGVVPVSLVISVFSYPILLLWTKDALLARSVAPILSAWMVGTALNGLFTMPYYLQMAYGYQKVIIVVYSACVALLVPALILATPLYGPIAAAATWVGINLSLVCIAVPVMHRKLLMGEMKSWYLVDLLLPTIAAAVFVTLALLAFRSLAGLSRFGTFGFLIFCALGAVFSAALATPVGRTTVFRMALGGKAKRG
jgi:O-antigen/teichoic acid export membrane protein